MNIPLDLATSATLLGTVASIAGLALAAVQSVRLRELRRRVDADVWQGVSTAQAAIRRLEMTVAVKEDVQVAQAYAKTTELLRQLIKQAALAERRFSDATVDEWIRLGKISGEWQIAAARRYVPHKRGCFPFGRSPDPRVSEDDSSKKKRRG